MEGRGRSRTPKRIRASAANSSASRSMSRSRSVSRSPYYPSLGPLSGTSRQAVRVGGWANPTRGGELKFTDVTNTLTLGVAAATWTTPGPNFLLNGLVPDSTATGRIGRKINMKSLYLRMTYSLAGTSTFGGPARVIVVYDKQANAQAPAVTDILLADSMLSPNNLSNRDRFVVLLDQMFDPISTAGNQVVSMEVYKKINLETMFNAGNAGTIGDITSGSVYILAAQAGFIGTAAPSINFRSRIRYTDV